MPAVTTLSHSLGPHHYARSVAAGSRRHLTGIELSSVDDTYAWSRANGAPNLRRLALFADEDSDRKRTSAGTRHVYHPARPDSGQVAFASARAQMAPRLRSPAP